MFTVRDWTSTVGTSFFSGFPFLTNFGDVSFDTASSTGNLTFGDAEFGTFTSTAITSDLVGRSLIVLASGDWTPGMFSGFSGLTGRFPSDITIALTQSSSGSIISGSGTFSAVPLPAALPLFATGLGGLGLLGWRRKRRARGVA
jgi:hypothetical protein